MGPKGKGNVEQDAPKAKTCSKPHQHCSDDEEDDCCNHREINFHDAPHRLVYALKGNQKELDVVTKAFEDELRELERKYEAMSKPFFLRRRAIILGETDANEEDVARGKASVEKELAKRAGNVESGATTGTSKVEVIESSEEEEAPAKGRKGIARKAVVAEGNKKAEEKSGGKGAEVGKTPETEGADEESAAANGIPHFWLNVLKRQFDVSKRDEEVLKHLVDVQCSSIDGDPFLGYMLSFHFSENPFFTNEVLTKHYYQEREFNDSILVRTEGCKIEWKGRTLNTTIEIKKKTQKNKVKKTTRVVEKEVKVDSFFDFFEPPKIPEDDDEEEEDMETDYDELEEKIEYDYEMGNALKDEIIPMAVDSYLGLSLSSDCSWMFPGAVAGAAEMFKGGNIPAQLKDGQQGDCKQQ